MSPQPGWYEDPTDPSALRWWDGAAWTAQTQEAPRELAMASASAYSSTATPTLAPAPVATTHTIAPLASYAGAPTIVPAHADDDEAAAPVPALAPASARPSTLAATPPPPLTTTYEPEPVEVDRSRPGGGGTAPMRDAKPVQTNLHATWVDDTPAAPPAGFVPGGASQFGAAPRKGGFTAGPGMDFSAVGHAGTPHPSRHWGRTIAVTVVALAVLAAFCVVAVPRYLTARAQGIAAEQPDVLAHAAPALLASQRRTPRADAGFTDAAKQLRSEGAQWSWAATYGSRTSTTSYLASDVPLDSRDEAVHALSSHDAANDLLSAVSKRVVPAGTGIVLGTPTEYASPVGGKTWCMQVTAGGLAQGYCVWTNGKEYLAVMAVPGLETSAGKSTLAALAQLARISTRPGK